MSKASPAERGAQAAATAAVVRTVMFISDGTGITAETLGHTLLTQFDVEFREVTLPYVDSIDAARRVVDKVRTLVSAGHPRPIIFSSVVRDDVRAELASSEATFFDVFDAFIGPLEQELGMTASHAIGQAHGLRNPQVYDVRIDAINFTLQHDDGASFSHYSRADVIIIGVSRTAKTPVSLYLALQYGIFTANYPLTEDDIMEKGLPRALRGYKDKLYGLSISAERLHTIRQERRPNSRYASMRQCQLEVMRAEALFRSNTIPWLNSTTVSIEEIATTIMHERGLRRRVQ